MYAADEASRTVAHAIVAGAIAAAQGRSATAGAAGAVTTVIMGEAIKNVLYGDIPVSQLNEEQKQTLVMLGTLAAGAAGGLTGGSTANAVTGAQAGQNEISNNTADMGMWQQMVAQETLNAAAMAEAGKGGANEQAALALTKAVKAGLSEACLANISCVIMAVVAAQQNGGSDNSSSAPNVGKDLTDAEKAELGGAGSGTPGGWEPEDEESARNQTSQTDNVPDSSEKLSWDSWQNYPKQTIDGRQYAQIGDRLYSQHAVDRMQPSGLGSPAGTSGPGRNVTPNMVENVIKNGSSQHSVVGGVARTTFWSGDIGVVTENNGNVIVTILRRSGQ